MDAALKAKWTQALRSGEFTQGSGQLRSPNKAKHCCLGVLCVVAGLPITDDGESIVGYEDGYAPLREMIGGEHTVFNLYSKNDDGTPFPAIADWIEERVALSSQDQTQRSALQNKERG